MGKPKFWFPTWSDTIQAVQLQKMDRGLKFWTETVEGSYYLDVVITKALISFAVTANLICVFVSRICKLLFSHDAAQITMTPMYM